MTILSAQSIRERKPVFPILEKKKVNGLSYGLSSATYDVRIAQSRLLWPGRFCLASTMEYFEMPNDIAALVCDKSTWARLGVCVQNTFIDPGFKGYLTLELTNHAWRFQKIHEGDPIAQILFLQLDKPTCLPYAGKYQGQKFGPQEPIRI